jgi:hypothetical protein
MVENNYKPDKERINELHDVFDAENSLVDKIEKKRETEEMNKCNIPFTRMIVQLPLDEGKPPQPPKNYFTVGWVICNPDRCEQFSSSCSSCKLDLVKRGLPAYNEEKKRFNAKKSGLILP